MTDTFSVPLTTNDIAVIHKALGEHLSSLLKEWEQQERAGASDAAANLYQKADDVRVLMNKVGAAPLNLR
jgi:hypothetical protein